MFKKSRMAMKMKRMQMLRLFIASLFVVHVHMLVVHNPPAAGMRALRWPPRHLLSKRRGASPALSRIAAESGRSGVRVAAAAEEEVDFAALREELDVLQKSIQKMREPSEARAMDSLSTAAAKAADATDEQWRRYVELMDSDLTRTLLDTYGAFVNVYSDFVANIWRNETGLGYEGALSLMGNADVSCLVGYSAVGLPSLLFTTWAVFDRCSCLARVLRWSSTDSLFF